MNLFKRKDMNMEIKRTHVQRKERERVCDHCPNLFLCVPYGGTCRKRERAKLFIRLTNRIKDYVERIIK